MSLAPEQVAGEVVADRDHVPPHGLLEEERVEGHDLVDVGGRQLEEPGHVLLDLERDVAEGVLRQVQHGQERAAACPGRAPGAAAPRQLLGRRTRGSLGVGAWRSAVELPADHVDGAEGRDDVGDHLRPRSCAAARPPGAGTAAGSARGTGGRCRRTPRRSRARRWPPPPAKYASPGGRPDAVALHDQHEVVHQPLDRAVRRPPSAAAPRACPAALTRA